MKTAKIKNKKDRKGASVEGTAERRAQRSREKARRKARKSSERPKESPERPEESPRRGPEKGPEKGPKKVRRGPEKGRRGPEKVGEGRRMALRKAQGEALGGGSGLRWRQNRMQKGENRCGYWEFWEFGWQRC